MNLDQAARSLFLKEFAQAFLLSMRYFFSRRRRSTIRSRKIRFRLGSGASTRCADTQTAKTPMDLQAIFFYLFARVCVALAIMVIAAKNAVSLPET
jgi:hypothetical protein